MTDREPIRVWSAEEASRLNRFLRGIDASSRETRCSIAGPALLAAADEIRGLMALLGGDAQCEPVPVGGAFETINGATGEVRTFPAPGTDEGPSNGHPRSRSTTNEGVQGEGLTLDPEALRKALISCVPNTWLDPILTGDNAAVKHAPPYSCKDVEAVLRAIKHRMQCEPAPEGVALETLPCRVKCNGGPGFSQGVKVSTLLGYFERRRMYNTSPGSGEAGEFKPEGP